MAETDLTSPPSGIRRWVRTSPLGSGSFGEVSLALDLDRRTLFAVKSAAPPSAAPHSPEHLALRNELSILPTLSCSRIVRCLGASVSGTHMFLEYVDGGSVADLIQKSGGKLEERRLRSITRGILEGLLYLHHHAGVVHCDIKGRNILLQSSTGAVKIADFGAAKRVATSSGSSFRGTPLWMAPEVVQGVEQGPASDIWSLGCTVVEMMQGRPPWSAQDKVELGSLLFKIACSTEEPPLPEAASPLAKDFLRKCLHRDPTQRWTAAQLLQHPFFLQQTQESTHVQDFVSSPRSILDLTFPSDPDSCTLMSSDPPTICCDLPPKSTGQVQLFTSSAAGAAAAAAAPSPPPPSPHHRLGEQGKAPCFMDNNWLRVRGSEGWSGRMEWEAAPQPCIVKKGCQVDFQCAAFLSRNRPRRTAVA